MTNKVQIGVDANVSGVDAGLGQIDQSVADVAKSVEQVGKASEKASAGLQRIEYSAKRLEAVARILSKEMGKAIDPKQADAFLRSFDKIRNNKSIGGTSRLRSFDSFEAWHAGNNQMFVRPGDAERYRRHVMGLVGGNAGMAFPVPAGGHGHGGGAGGHGGGSGTSAPGTPSEGRNWGSMASRGAMSIKGVAAAGLALAGVTSLMAMAGRAVDLARQEATTTDQLLRKSNDLTQGFDELRAKVRASGEGLGVLYTEAAALGKHYVEVANGDGGGIQGNLRTGFGLSRAYGLDLSEGVSFMAQMRHQGQIKSDDRDGRKFAMLIAEAIERGQTTGKAGEVLNAVASFSSQVARLALSSGNVAGFGGALAGLTSSNDIGLKGDPSNAAALLMSVDNAIRGGGGMGEAGLNFSYGALSRAMPNLDPIMAKAVLEQGAFGSGVSSAVREFAGKNGIDLPSFTGKDNLSLVMDEMDRQYGGSSLKLDAIKNYFGLSSYGQAAALSNLDRKELTGLQSAVGDDIGKLSASGIAGAARISTASDEDLKKMAERLSKRSDLTDKERNDIQAKLADGDMSALREVMLKAVAVREQEANAGTETRDAVNALHNTLTDIGGVVLPAVTAIQDAVVAMARALAPESEYAKDQALAEGMGGHEARRRDMEARHAEELRVSRENADKRNASPQLRAMVEREIAQRQEAERYQFEREESDFIEFKKRGAASSPADAALERMRGRDGELPGSAGVREPITFEDVPQTPGEQASAGGAPESLVRAMIMQESGGNHYGKDGKLLQSGKGARGIAQIMPGTGVDPGYGVKPLQNDSEAEHLRFGRDYLNAMLKEFGGDKRKALAAYNAGPGNVHKAIAAGGSDWLSYLPQETQAYVPSILSRANADSLSGNIPAGNPAGSPNGQPIVARVEGAFTLRDFHGIDRADPVEAQTSVKLPVAAGAGRT